MSNAILKGNLDMLLLSVLRTKSLHGYAIIEALRDKSEKFFDLPEGTIYPALHRLEDAGLLASDWEQIDGRKRRVYSITAQGKQAFRQQKQTWSSFVSAISGVLGVNHA